MADLPLTSDDIALIAKAASGKLITPMEKTRLQTIQGGMTKDDHNYQAVTAALANAQEAGSSAPRAALPTASSNVKVALPPVAPDKKAATPVAEAALPGDPQVKTAREILQQAQAQQAAKPAAQQEARRGGTTSPPPNQPAQGGNPLTDALRRFDTMARQPWTADALAPSNNVDPNSPAGRALGVQTTASSLNPTGSDQGPETIGVLPFGGFDMNSGLQTGKYTGYSFASLTPEQRDQLFNDPSGSSLEAMALAKQAGGGDATAYSMLPYVDAAMHLAASGAIGGPTQGPGANQGPSSTAAQLAAVEDLINAANKPGVSMDPSYFMQTTLDRLRNTPIEQFSKLAPQGGAANLANANADDQVTATNNMLQYAGQMGLGPQTQKNLAKLLAMTALQWKQGRMDGSITMTYPDYLNSIGIVGMFSGG